MRFVAELGRWYFGPWRFELVGNGRVYELLGIRFWKRWLRTSGNPLSRRAGTIDLPSRRDALRERLRQQDRFTREYELRHLLGGAVMQMAGWAVIAMVEGASLAALTIANVLVNGYPILLQRYNRVRVHAALGRIGHPKDLPAARQTPAADEAQGGTPGGS